MRKHLLIIGFVWPEPKSSAAGSRMLQLIEAFQLDDYKITFASPCTKSDNAFDLESIDVTPSTIKLNNSSFDTFVKNLNPDVVLFDRFMMEEQFGWRVSEQCPNALRVLDTEDFHSLRKGRQQAFKDGKTFDDSYLFSDIAKREIASIYRCDLSLMISEAEMDILKQQFKVDESLLLYSPFMLKSISKRHSENLPKFENRNHFITIGNFLHEPNYNAVLYLKETIWPLIRAKLPQAELHVYGAYASQKVNQLHNEKEGFLIKGFAEDVDTVMKNAKVCLVPVRFGAGLKGKIVDAMKNGTPVVTTSIGAEGMYGNLEPNAFIEDNPEAFALKSVQLYEDENSWCTLQANGFNVINNRFDKNKHQKILLNKNSKIASQLKQHRMSNFTGQMLQHHALQSTKFMSKWIEEKHKNE
ncbi:glycosyltransferase [Algibacter luteus]|uniref:glycosyltransferase n=1 Tax=Algibacter luteus TaxID=1178825 RepID=UPI002593D5AB|nr:glycosyltransferase [Algibacter luteus]WJJ97922.1 glycosyltransferase [Algibacter luteus]